jgi:predicted RNase H-like HicB family nuclease
MSTEYTYIVRHAEEGGYWAEVPALPGCFTQGETLDEVAESIKDAIEAHVLALREEGQDVPVDPGLFVGRVAVA